MNPQYLSFGLALLVAIITFVVWLVRMESKVSGHASRLLTLEDQVKIYAETKIEVVRLQERIDQMRQLLERFLDRS